jgi:hypothetical protein
LKDSGKENSSETPDDFTLAFLRLDRAMRVTKVARKNQPSTLSSRFLFMRSLSAARSPPFPFFLTDTTKFLTEQAQISPVPTSTVVPPAPSPTGSL